MIPKTEIAFLWLIRVFLFSVCLFSCAAPSWADTFEVDVSSSKGSSLSGLKVYSFEESGAYTGYHAATNTDGIAQFNIDDFAEGSYSFRIDYLGAQFWSDTAMLPGDSSVSVFIEEGEVVVDVTTGLSPLTDIKVYLFNAQGAYLGRYDLTDSNGQVSFFIPTDMEVKFRADYSGYQFWSVPTVVTPFMPIILDILHQSVNIVINGEFQGENQPLDGINVYLFKPPESYLGRYEVTDVNGSVIFNLPEQAFKVRVDYLGQRFWSDEFTHQNTTVSIPMADAEVLVTGGGIPLPGLRIYVFSQSGSYLGIYGTSDQTGTVIFRLPAGNYKFRADYQGNQFWSLEEIILADVVNPVSISTGGGNFSFTLQKGISNPLEGVNCYVFNETGAYLGINATTDSNGTVDFALANGDYQIRADYMGYQFWGGVYEIPATLAAAYQIDHTDVTISINGAYQGASTPLEDIRVYLFKPSGNYLGLYEETDIAGQVVFNLPGQPYKVRADYLGRQYWSEEFTAEAAVVSVPMADADILVTGSGLPLSNVMVYVFSQSGAYLGIHDTTDEDGAALFRLPAAAYKFRADYLGAKYWSGEVVLQKDIVNPIDIFTGGGTFNLTVLKDAETPLVGVKTYLFNDNNAYLGIQATTSDNGLAIFDISEGDYQFRVDTLGNQFWSSPYNVPNTLSGVFTIPHQDVTITVQGIDPEPTPLEGIKTYLFSPLSSYLGKDTITDASGRVVFSLPDREFKVRADYLGYQFWSDVFQWQDTILPIYRGTVELHVNRDGTDIAGARVYLFTESGTYLGRYEITDASGRVSFLLPEQNYKFRIDEGGDQYWSDVIAVDSNLPTDVEIALSPPVVEFTADPLSIQLDQDVVLTWITTGAYSCSIEPDIGAVLVNDSLTVSPIETTTYTLTAIGSGGETTATITVEVLADLTVPADADLGYAVDEKLGGLGLIGFSARILNGNMTESRTDLRFPSPSSFGLSFSSFYNSRSSLAGSMGFGWTHMYSAVLFPSFDIDGIIYLKIIEPTGRSIYFKEKTTGRFEGAFFDTSRVQFEEGIYIWYRLNGSRYGFSDTGRLIWIEDEKGNRLSLSYDGQNRLETVTDESGNRVLSFTYNADNLLTSIIGPATSAVPDRLWVTYGYDQDQNLTTVSYADGSGVTYGYTDSQDPHNLTEKRNNANHLLTTWSYDSQDRCTNRFNPFGTGFSIGYTSETRVEVTDAYGTVRTYTIGGVSGRSVVTAMQGLSSAPYGGGNLKRWAYDSQLNLTELETVGGTVHAFQNHDDRGNPQTVILAAGTSEERVISYAYHPDMNTVLSRVEASVLGSGNKETVFDYDDDSGATPNESPSRLIRRVVERGFTKDAANTVVPYEYITVLSYNSKGQITGMDGPLAGAEDTTSLTYHSSTGDLLSLEKPLIGITGFSGYDTAGNPGIRTNVNGQSDTYIYDGRARMTSVTHQSDDSSYSIVYNNAGFVDSKVNEDSVTMAYSYGSTYGRLDRATDIDGNYMEYAYDSQGNRIESSKYDSSGNRFSIDRWSYQHPSLPGRLWKVIRYNDSFSEYQYDSEGNVSAITNFNGNTTQYEYDPLNRRTRVIQPGNLTTVYDYDQHGNRISVTDAEGHTTAFIYDDMRRVVASTSPDTGTKTYVYDAAGNLSVKSDASGITVQYDHDELNRLTATHFPDSGQDITYTYDTGAYGIGRRTGITDPSGSANFVYDARGRLIGKTSTVSGVPYPLSRAYTPGGKVQSVTYPTGRTIDYTRYPNGKTQSVSTTHNSTTVTLVSNLSYNAFSEAKGMSTGYGGSVDNQYSDCGCLEIINPGSQTEQTYAYDNNRNITDITAPNIPKYDLALTYDSLNRLTDATGWFGTIGYTYDKVGNRLTKTTDGSTETYSYISGSNKLEQITGAEATVNFTYDVNGNMIGHGDKILTYNQSNRLIRLEENSQTLGEYTYNALGQRVTKTVEGETTVFLYDFDGNIIAESQPGGTIMKEYLYAGQVRMAMVDTTTGTLYYYANNHLGAPILMTDASGMVAWEAEYRPFGEADVNPHSEIENNFRLPGQYYDQESNLHYNYFRYYQTQTGRYIRPDPIGLNANINLLTYVENNPVNFIDPYGLWDLISSSQALHGSKPEPGRSRPLTPYEKKMLKNIALQAADTAMQKIAQNLAIRYIGPAVGGALSGVNFVLIILDPFPPPAGGPEDMIATPLELLTPTPPPDLPWQQQSPCKQFLFGWGYN